MYFEHNYNSWEKFEMQNSGHSEVHLVLNRLGRYCQVTCFIQPTGHLMVVGHPKREGVRVSHSPLFSKVFFDRTKAKMAFYPYVAILGLLFSDNFHVQIMQIWPGHTMRGEWWSCTLLWARCTRVSSRLPAALGLLASQCRSRNNGLFLLIGFNIYSTKRPICVYNNIRQFM